MANPEDLGRYRFKRLLGRGALGEVWEALDLEEEGAKVAVKIMRAADEELAFARECFARDALLARRVRHPHVAVVHDAGEAAGTSFMVMAMVEGRPLRAALREPSTTIVDKVRWIRQVGEALSAMHRIGLVHRDLKPENVLIRADGSACVVDLGIAKWVKVDTGAAPADDAVAFETPVQRSAYVPPEAAEHGVYDELGDQFAWAVMAHEVLTGAAPNDGGPADGEPLELPAPVAVSIARARSRDPSERWGAMDRLLEHASAGLRSLADPEVAVRSASAAPLAGADPAGATEESAVNTEGSVPARGRSPVVVGAWVLALLVLAVAALAALR